MGICRGDYFQQQLGRDQGNQMENISEECCSSSSIDSNYCNYNYNNNNALLYSSSSTISSSSSSCLSTDLRLGLSISSSSDHLQQVPSSSTSSSRKLKQRISTGAYDYANCNHIYDENNKGIKRSYEISCLFVKVYMEGIPIGRKLDLMAHDGYHSLVACLSHMFKTTILYPDGAEYSRSSTRSKIIGKNFHVLAYEDKEGDWMMVGDVPWKMFLNTVKRLKITGFPEGMLIDPN